jgi:hypothetical protein
MAWRRRWSLALARTPLWVPASRAALCLPPQHTRAAAPIAPKSIWLLTVVVEADLEMSTTGHGDGGPTRAGRRILKTTTRTIMCEAGNILV